MDVVVRSPWKGERAGEMSQVRKPDLRLTKNPPHEVPWRAALYRRWAHLTALTEPFDPAVSANRLDKLKALRPSNGLEAMSLSNGAGS